MAITVRQVEAAADAMMLHMFAPHELPLDAELRAKYMDVAKVALQAAERIRNQGATAPRRNSPLMTHTIALADHPFNLDPGTALVSGPCYPYSVFRVAGGYVAAFKGRAWPEVFSSEADARNTALRLEAMIGSLEE